MHTKKEKHILLDKVALSVYHAMKTNKKIHNIVMTKS